MAYSLWHETEARIEAGEYLIRLRAIRYQLYALNPQRGTRLAPGAEAAGGKGLTQPTGSRN